MASIETRINDKGQKRYVVRWRDPMGNSRNKTFALSGEAKKFQAIVTTDLARGTYVDTGNLMTVQQYARQWLAARPVRQTSRTRIESYFRCHLDGTYLGGRRLVDVRPTEVQAWLTGLHKITAKGSESLAPNTHRAIQSYMRSIFAAAVKDRLIALSPATETIRPKVARRKRLIPLSIAQVVSVADAMPERYRAMVLAQSGLGLRVGELLALRVADVDFLRREVRVDAQICQDTRERVDWCKSATSHRTLPLPTVVADALAAHLAEYPVGEHGFLFTSGRRDGRPVTQSHYDRMLHRSAAAAGVPDLTSHALRHHYASVLLAAGESVLVVSERLGHDDGGELVMRTYGHLLPDSEDRTRQAIDGAWSTARVACVIPVSRAGSRGD